MITRVNRFRALDDKTEQMFEFLQSLVPYISGCDGCISCELLRQQDDPSRMLVIERWQDEASHAASLAGFPQDKMQTAMDLFAEPPEGAFYI